MYGRGLLSIVGPVISLRKCAFSYDDFSTILSAVYSDCHVLVWSLLVVSYSLFPF